MGSQVILLDRKGRMILHYLLFILLIQDGSTSFRQKISTLETDRQTDRNKISTLETKLSSLDDKFEELERKMKRMETLGVDCKDTETPAGRSVPSTTSPSTTQSTTTKGSEVL